MSTEGPASPRSEPSGDTPPVTVRRSRPAWCPLACDHRGHGLAQGVVVGQALEAEAGGRATQPGQVAGGGERGRRATIWIVSKTPSPTVTPWSSGDTPARSSRHQRAVDPHHWADQPWGDAPTTSGWLEATSRSRRAFSSVSAHSPAGVESQVMPPPVPKCRRAVVDPEGADGDVELALAAIGVDPADRAAVDAALDRLEPGDVVERGQLGRAGDRAGREGGVDERRPTRGRGAARPSTVLTRWTSPGWGSTASSAGTGPSRTRTPGPGRCARGRRSSRSRPGPWGGSRPRWRRCP